MTQEAIFFYHYFSFFVFQCDADRTFFKEVLLILLCQLYRFQGWNSFMISKDDKEFLQQESCYPNLIILQNPPCLS